MEALIAYLIDNLVYFFIVGLTLLVWNFTDLYIELKRFSFIRRREFWIYYLIGAFFSIVALEAGIILGLFETENKSILAFVAPLAFSIILGNLVVKVGGVENSVNFSDFFDKFRFAIRQSLDVRIEMDKVKLQAKLLESNIDPEEILNLCRFYSDEKEIEDLIKRTEKMQPETRKIELIKCLVKKAKTVEVTKILKRVKKPSPRIKDIPSPQGTDLPT